MSNPPILQTPLNEERNLKRDREKATPSSRPFAQNYAKRQRLNPHSEQEYTEETTRTSRAERTESRHTTPSRGRQEPSTSMAQMLQRKQSVEVSSFRAPTRQSLDIKEKYKEIKARNERLKVQRYAHYLKMAPTNQTRLMSAFDIKEGKMQMSFLKPTI